MQHLDDLRLDDETGREPIGLPVLVTIGILFLLAGVGVVWAVRLLI
ncbi:hypothetical protein [Variovorax saccharolyticus]|nr:hypothetical protein [Variovorax sp. J31P216]MDM0030417.1 hypothetical protein [Variovorax sp. J31P216]